MQNLGLVFALCFLYSQNVWAEETLPSNTKAISVEEKSQIEENVVSDETPIEIKSVDIEIPEPAISAIPRPTCENKELVDGILNKISAYQKEHPAAMLIEKRRDLLLLKNLNAFKEISVKNFTDKQNFNVANRIIMAKINKGILEPSMVLCKSKGQGKAGDVYALLYPVGDGHVVEVVNFLPINDEASDFSFMFNQ